MGQDCREGGGVGGVGGPGPAKVLFNEKIICSLGPGAALALEWAVGKQFPGLINMSVTKGEL